MSTAVPGTSDQLHITVVGCGYLGAVHAACMAQLGHDVIGIDVDPRKVEALENGKDAITKEVRRGGVPLQRLVNAEAMGAIAAELIPPPPICAAHLCVRSRAPARERTHGRFAQRSVA